MFPPLGAYLPASITFSIKAFSGILSEYFLVLHLVIIACNASIWHLLCKRLFVSGSIIRISLLILQNDFNALACEMEGAAVADVCTQYQVPFVVIRTMSDKADGEAHETYENFQDQAASNSCQIIMQMLK